MKKIILGTLYFSILFTSCENKNETKKSDNITSGNTEISEQKSKDQIVSSKEKTDKGNKIAEESTQGKSQSDKKDSKEKSRNEKEGGWKIVSSPSTRSQNYEDSYSSSTSIEIAGVYICSNEDMIRLNSNGTGRMAMSYNFDGVRSFTWEYDNQREELSISSIPPEEMRYEMLPIF